MYQPCWTHPLYPHSTALSFCFLKTKVSPNVPSISWGWGRGSTPAESHWAQFSLLFPFILEGTVIGDSERLLGCWSQCAVQAHTRSPELTLNLIRKFVSWFVENQKKLAGKPSCSKED